jgi:hypothetical protein
MPFWANLFYRKENMSAAVQNGDESAVIQNDDDALTMTVLCNDRKTRNDENAQ